MYSMSAGPRAASAHARQSSAFHRSRLAVRTSPRRENSKMTHANPNHGAKHPAGWALMPASGQAIFPTTIPTTTPTTTPTTCVKSSRARRNRWQANQMRQALILACGGAVLKSLLRSLVLSPSFDTGMVAEAKIVVRLESERGCPGHKRRARRPRSGGTVAPPSFGTSLRPAASRGKFHPLLQRNFETPYRHHALSAEAVHV